MRYNAKEAKTSIIADKVTERVYAMIAMEGTAASIPTKITLLILPTIVMYLFLKLKLRELYIDFFQMKTEINRPVYIPRYGFDKCRN